MLTIASAFAIALGSVQPREAARSGGFSARSGFFGPKAPLHYSRPTLRWQVWSDQGDVTAVEMTVNGRQVEATYDRSARSLVYTPRDGFPAGDIAVHCSVTFAGAYSFQRDWSTRIPADAITSLPAGGDQEYHVLARINSYRKNLRLPEFQLNDAMSAAARAHCRYLEVNATGGHYESPEAEAFAGVDPSARLESYGWGGGCWEGLTCGISSPDEAIDCLFAAPYHRLPFMQPGSGHLGFGKIGTKIVAEFEDVQAAGIVCSPAEGETNVPTSWECHESPSPFRAHPGAETSESFGYPVVVSAFGSAAKDLRVVQAVLADGTGNSVACWLNTPDNDDELHGAVILIPKTPLNPHSSYTVDFTGRSGDGRTVHVRSSFTTSK